MERHQTQCPNCGSAEFISPVIDNQIALLLAGNSPIVTVTCTHCGSKFQTDASINMVAARQPAPQPVITTPAAPEEKSSRLTLQIVRIIAILASIPAAIVALISLIVTFTSAPTNERGGMIIMTLIYIGGTAALIAMARNCGKRIANIQKRLNNQL